MSDNGPGNELACDTAANMADPMDDPTNIIYGCKNGVAYLNHGPLDVIMRAPLPGIVIFVHGVNSDGEWYTATEKGLCAGLNDRLKRRDEHMAHPTPEGGQLTPATYMPELTADGFINPKMSAKNFIKGDDNFTPVIHFRWGYKANPDELQRYGSAIYLNEEGYWGGGPFANGCTALPDMWGDGISDDLFLFMHVEHLNPTKDRNVFSCPPRPYYVLAALRLARLVGSIRKKQADVPITIVCHSQGNMIGITAAFLGDAMAPVKDIAGTEGRCVADTYVLCNAPYSLLKSNFTEDWSEGNLKDRHGGSGRQTEEARIHTLRAFFDIIRKPAAPSQTVEKINQSMENSKHGFDAAVDRKKYGIAGATCRRVTLYCNPHDQVISSTTVQGIGWRGLSQQEIDASGGAGIFTQRVFAQEYYVGKKGEYHFWKDHYKHPAVGSDEFWFPESPKVKYSISKGLEANRGKWVGRVLTVAAAPIGVIATNVFTIRINALPEKNWKIPLEAPDLPDPFKPQAQGFGPGYEHFDQGYDARGQSRDKHRVRPTGDPYAGDRKFSKSEAEQVGASTDAAIGNEDTEAMMRYEDHARLRMQAKREGKVKSGEKVVEEDHPETASADYTAWRNKNIKTYLAENIDAHATDHSTIMTNDMHAQKALAYDVAIGLCQIRDKDLHSFRIAADWRFLDGLADDDPSSEFNEYFESGFFKKKTLQKWTVQSGSEGNMPEKIVDMREHPAFKPQTRRGGHP